MQGAHAQNVATILLSLFNFAGGVNERLLRSTSCDILLYTISRRRRWLRLKKFAHGGLCMCCLLLNLLWSSKIPRLSSGVEDSPVVTLCTTLIQPSLSLSLSIVHALLHHQKS